MKIKLEITITHPEFRDARQVRELVQDILDEHLAIHCARHCDNIEPLKIIVSSASHSVPSEQKGKP